MCDKGQDDTTQRQPELPPAPNDGAAAPADKSDTHAKVSDLQAIRNGLTKAIQSARSVLDWSEIQEVVIAATLNEKGVKVNLL